MFAYWGDTSTGTLVSILIWVLIAVAVVEIVHAIFSTRHRALPPEAKSPLDILNERYAKGEISKEEFDQKKADILNRVQ